jgi:hypothetical protein
VRHTWVPGGIATQALANTDNHVEGIEKLIEHGEGLVRDAVGHHEDAATHVEAHLEDVNSSRRSGGDDNHCTFEARVAG